MATLRNKSQFRSTSVKVDKRPTENWLIKMTDSKEKTIGMKAKDQWLLGKKSLLVSVTRNFKAPGWRAKVCSGHYFESLVQERNVPYMELGTLWFHNLGVLCVLISLSDITHNTPINTK